MAVATAATTRPRLPRRPLLLLCAAAIVAASASGWRRVVVVDDAGRGRGRPRATSDAAGRVRRSFPRANRGANRTTADATAAGAFFDCDREGSKCAYFRPGEFFRSYVASHRVAGNGTLDGGEGGEDYRSESYKAWRRTIGLENANLPALDSLSWWIDGGAGGASSNGSLAASAPPRSAIGMPPDVTYVHLHKCGGTSVQGAMYRRARRIRRSARREGAADEGDDGSSIARPRAEVRTYKHSFGGGSREKKLLWDEMRTEHVRSVVRAQSGPGGPSAHPAFTVARDPIARFLSGVQQVMHYNVDFREKCLHEPLETWSSKFATRAAREERMARCRRRTIECAAKDAEETSYRRDVHLLPMASHFRLLADVSLDDDGGGGEEDVDDGRDRRRDVVVSLFRMEDIPHVLSFLGGDGQDDVVGREGARGQKQTTTLHARDRSDATYATSPILAGLSSRDCSEETIRRICDLYRVDVAMVRGLGFGGEAARRCG